MHDAADDADIVFHELEQSTTIQPKQPRLFDGLDRCGARLGIEQRELSEWSAITPSPRMATPVPHRGK